MYVNVVALRIVLNEWIDEEKMGKMNDFADPAACLYSDLSRKEGFCCMNKGEKVI